MPQGRRELELNLDTLLAGETVALSTRTRLLVDDLRLEWRELDRRIDVFDAEFAAQARTDETAHLLTTIPGIGPLNATALAPRVTPESAVHLWQHHFGKPSRSGYHNKEWAQHMHGVGLVPSDTGAPGGKEVGQKVSHYIEAGGRSDQSCAALMRKGFQLPYVGRWTEGGEKTKKKKVGSKTRYTCPNCGLNAWAKPGVLNGCIECEKHLEAEEEGL
jgi:hypothetical protein